MLNSKQKSFLLSEFGIDDNKLREMTPEEWKDIRFKCFSVECDETALSNDEETCDVTNKGTIAASIADIKYKDMIA